MAILDTSIPSELRLVLRGSDENAILETLRHWPHWRRVEIEKNPLNHTQCLSITLIADRSQESTIRDVLRRSFGMTFPPEGGDRTLVVAAPPKALRRR